MSKAERLATLGFEELTAVNNMLAARPDKTTRDIKDRVATDLVRMLQRDRVELPLRGFAISAAVDVNTKYYSGTSHVTYDEESFRPFDHRGKTHEGKWIEPDHYWIGGDNFGYDAGLTAMLRPVQWGPQGDIKRYQVIMDSIGIATPEEIAPAEAVRDANWEKLSIVQDILVRSLDS